jgi:hypothetical protein
MTVIYSPLESSYGFTSPGFTVDTVGNITAPNITVSNIVMSGDLVANGANLSSALSTLRINGVIKLSATALGATVVTSSLTSVGTLTGLTINGQLTVSNGVIQLTSSTVGTLDNVNIGSTTPGTGAFTGLAVTATPTTNTSVTNKLYVDQAINKRSAAYAIALGS